MALIIINGAFKEKAQMTTNPVKLFMAEMEARVRTLMNPRTASITVTVAMAVTAVAAVAAVAPQVTISIQTKNGPVPVAQAEQAVRAATASKAASLSIINEVII